jgi:hypothetical protein
MQIRPLSAFGANPDSITLIDGTVVPYTDVTFDSSNYTFTYTPEDDSGGIDITNNIKRSDQLTFPGFDVTTANYWGSYRAGHGLTTIADAGISPGAPLDTSVTSLFAKNIANEASFGTGSITSKIGQYVAIGFGAWLLIQLIKK